MPRQLNFFGTPTLTISPQSSIILMLDRTRLGMSRKVDLKKLTNVSEELRQELISATARILDCPELKAIASLDSQKTAWIRRYSTPSIFRWGAYLFARDLMDTADAQMRDYQERRDPLVKAFVAKYTEITEAARVKLGPKLASAIEWPNPDLVPNLFTLRWRWMAIGVPADLGDTSAPSPLVQRILDEAEADAGEQRDTIRLALRKEFRDLLRDMTVRLAAEPKDGTTRVPLRASVLGNLTDWLARLPSRSLVDDEPLQTLVNDVQIALDGITLDGLRELAALRTGVILELERALVILDTLIPAPVTRTIAFEDDDPVPAANTETAPLLALVDAR